MRSHLTRKSCNAVSLALKMAGGVAAVCSLFAATPARADKISVSAQSDTIFRLGQTFDRKDLFPAYEYLRLSVADIGPDGGISFHFGGWGRTDLSNKRTTGKYSDGDLQYGYLSYQAKQNNGLINVGRQFVTEGVASERLDGLYVRNDFMYGFGAAAFIGAPVISETDTEGGDFVYGARITHSMPKYYTIGISALQTKIVENRFREEEGVDIWLHPLKQVDVTGRSSYNSLTNGWMEHAYSVSYSPLESIRLNADLSNINYKDYFFHMTTNVFSLFSPTNPSGIIDPNEKLLAIGGSVSVIPDKSLTITADYKNFRYDIAKTANYYGVKATCLMPESFTAGVSVHRMDGEVDKLKFSEIRLFASKKISHLDLAADLISQTYDAPINGLQKVYTVAGSAGYEISESLKIGADFDWSQNPDFKNDVKGLAKITYMFDTKHAAEGRAKSEKY